MAQDTALLRYLLKGARRAPGSGSQRDLAFAFDGTNDFISSNATIGRTGYDLNVAGNVSTSSDSDGSYFWINGNRDATAATGTSATMNIASALTYTQAQSFTIKARIKFNSIPANNSSGIFGTNGFATALTVNSAGNIKYGLRGSSTVDYTGSVISTGVLYDAHLVYDAASGKMFNYLNGTLLNSGGTSGPATFTFSGLCLGDNALISGNPTSCNKQIYHAAIRNVALTQAEIDADIALGNTAKNDPSIVAYYIPENLTYNTQYLANPKDLDNATRTKGTGTTVTANTTVAPDGTTTADQVVWTGVNTATSKVMAASSPSLSGATLASKTFIVKAFVKVSAGTAAFRQWIAHGAVADYRSSDQTATTTRQEFTFTQTLTSSTSGVSLSGGICCNSTNTAATLEVRNVRLFLVNETLRDESPNIGGFIGWKTQKVLSCRVKPNIDGVATSSSQPLLRTPRLVSYIANNTNNPVVRYDNRFGGQQTTGASLGSGFRGKVHYSFIYKRDSGNQIRVLLIYKNGVLDITQNKQAIPPNSIGGAGDTLFRMGIHPAPVYFSGNIRDPRIYTFTGSFTDADALAIYNGGEPTSSGITKYLHYRPPVGEVGTTTQDQSSNDRDGTLNNGVTRDYI